MAAATSVAQVAAALTVYPYVMSRVLGIPVSRLLVTQVKAGIPAALVAVPAAIVMMRLLLPENWPLLLIDIGVVSVVTAIVGLFFVLESTDRKRILDVLTSRNRRDNPR